MKKINPIEIKTVGEPTLEHLSESEQKLSI